MVTKAEKKICFVISPIGTEGSETRKHSDTVLKHIITEPTDQMGYKVIRADKISEPGIITSQIIQYIVDSPLVIADLTERNPNVFYELALRHVSRKPLVQLIKKGEDIPFDVAATRVIQFDLSLDSVAAAKAEILSQITSLEEGKVEVHNPISSSLDLKMLKESGKQEERSLAEVVEAISNLRVAISSVDKNSSDIKERIKDISGERRFDPEYRRRRKFHPMLFDEMMHMEMETGDPNLSFLMMISLLKDDFPWMFEVGLETYRGLKSAKSKTEKRKQVQTFEKAFEMLGHPMMREFSGKSEELYMYTKDIRHFMHRYLERFLMEGNDKK